MLGELIALIIITILVAIPLAIWYFWTSFTAFVSDAVDSLNPLAGAECIIGPAGHGQCPAGQYCNGQKCVDTPSDAKPPGGSCASDSQCQSGICIIGGTNHCADAESKLPPGTHCTLDSQCMYGKCMPGAMKCVGADGKLPKGTYCTQDSQCTSPYTCTTPERTCGVQKTVIDCAKYGDGIIPTPTCPWTEKKAVFSLATGLTYVDVPTHEYWGGLCYEKCPTGYRRTASCTCQGDPGIELMTKCGIGIENIGMGKECTAANGVRLNELTTWSSPGFRNNEIKADGGKGWFKTAACTCQKGGAISTYCGSKTPVQTCPSDREMYAGLCPKKCPSDRTRTSACGCTLKT